ncbi:hypothetical protein [Alcanivorax sp.]|nr:hypothetical protein [Alcanivorax sp.]
MWVRRYDRREYFLRRFFMPADNLFHRRRHEITDPLALSAGHQFTGKV